MAAHLQFLRFPFIPQGFLNVLCYIILMPCTHPVLECIEQAEVDYGITSVNCQHHINYLDWVLIEVGRVVYVVGHT